MLQVPLLNQSTEQSMPRVLEFKQEQLPEDINRLVYIFQREKVPIGYWHQVALMYYRKGEHQKFSQILNEALKDVNQRQNLHLYKPDRDRIKALNSLASYYIHLSEAESNEETRQKHISSGNDLIQAADNLNLHELSTFITKCFFYLAQGYLNSTYQYLEHFAHANYDHPLWKILKGIIEFSKGNVKESLATFKKVLQQNPRTPPQIRLPIGLCYFRLGNLEKARFAFERVLELDPNNSMALVALSIVELSTNVNDFEMRSKAAKLLEQGFKADNNNSLAMKYLAENYFTQKEYQLSQKMCERGLLILGNLRKSESSTKENPYFRKEIDFLRSDFNFIIGKIHHVQENYKDAQVFYQHAVKHNQNNFPAQLGLGKIHFYYGTFVGAEQCLLTITSTQKHKDCYEALKLLAQCKARQGKKEDAVELFKRVIELNPKDHESNLEVAQLFEQQEPKNALVYYEAALRIIAADVNEKKKKNGNANSEKTVNGEVVPAELLINIGVLRLEVGNVKEAHEAFQKALSNVGKQIKAKPEDKRLLAIRITAKFNLGYWYEQNYRIGEANELYKSIITEEPAYVDAYLRLAFLAKQRGSIKRAMEYIEQAKKNQFTQPDEPSRPVNQFCIKGKMLSDNMEYQQSYNEFSFVLQALSKNDSYSLIGQANISYEAFTHKRQDQSQESNLKKAMDKYVAVLEVDEANCYATLGVGNILAEYGKLNEAMEIFKVVKENNPNMYHPYVNQAHLSMAQNNFEGAINLYKKCLEKFFVGGRDLEIEMFISKAYFKMKAYDLCRKILISLIQRHPQVLRLRLNLALCLWAQATETFNKNFRRVSETKEAISNLKHAEKLFNQIMRQNQTLFNFYHSNLSKEAKDAEASLFGQIFRICDERLNYVKDMIQSSQQYLEFDEQREQDIQLQDEEKTQRLYHLQTLQDKEQEQRQALLRKRQEEEQERAEQNLEEVAKLALDNLNKPIKPINALRLQDDGEPFINDEEKDLLDQNESDAEIAKLLSEESDDEDFKIDEVDQEGAGADQGIKEQREKKRDKKLKKKDKKKHKKRDKDRKKLKKHHRERRESELAPITEESHQSIQERPRETQGLNDVPSEPVAGRDHSDDRIVGKKRRLKRVKDLEELEEEEKAQTESFKAEEKPLEKMTEE